MPAYPSPLLLQVVANFGNDLAARPFRGDPAWVRQEATQRLYSTILATPLPRSSPKVGGRVAGRAGGRAGGGRQPEAGECCTHGRGHPCVYPLHPPNCTSLL